MGEYAKKATMEEVWAATLASERPRPKGEEALRETLRKAEEVRIKGEKALQESHVKTAESLRQTQKEVRELNESLKEGGGNFNNKWGHFLENLLE